MDWLRWHNGTVTDPKWRVIARRAGVPLHMVIALWPLLLEEANQGTERGTIDGFDAEDAAAALDMEPGQVRAVLDAMQGKVLDGLRLTGWEKRNPKREREDSSTDRVRRYRERQKEERQVTPGNAMKPLERVEREVTTAVETAASEPEFDQAWAAYPKRAGDNPKRRALKAWLARRKTGVPAAEMLAGVDRYARYVRAKGQEGTEFVMQAATFFGPDERWGEPYSVNGNGARQLPEFIIDDGP